MHNGTAGGFPTGATGWKSADEITRAILLDLPPFSVPSWPPVFILPEVCYGGLVFEIIFRVNGFIYFIKNNRNNCHPTPPITGAQQLQVKAMTSAMTIITPVGDFQLKFSKLSPPWL